MGMIDMDSIIKTLEKQADMAKGVGMKNITLSVQEAEILIEILKGGEKRVKELGPVSGDTMQLDEYQRLAQRTSRRDLSQEEHLLNAMLGLSGETGECCDLVEKSRYQDNRMIEEPLIDELGDVLWYVAEAASAIGVPLGGVAMHNIAKLRERYPDGFDPERSLHREGEQK
jgi:NTP pyrophosphatase (non-canonical NTP hydrolase)